MQRKSIYLDNFMIAHNFQMMYDTYMEQCIFINMEGILWQH